MSRRERCLPWLAPMAPGAVPRPVQPLEHKAAIHIKKPPQPPDPSTSFRYDLTSLSLSSVAVPVMAGSSLGCGPRVARQPFCAPTPTPHEKSKKRLAVRLAPHS